ncbi:unnamed protein product [Adineta ricciae]|uniref:NHL repeat containing protein n=1 Tax=Adineta ricciae TaxID=249248 RepID=A0A814U120_ADIRI|nr:unnamed protein product [Adineta ricciae]CAF1505716.1 unnamed protein product [Adineta ricciae]
MEKKNSEKESLQNSDESSSIFGKFWSIIRSNWLSITCALIICVITIVVVPIIYSIEKSVQKNNETVLLWNTKGITIINQMTLLMNTNNSIGLISALEFGPDGNLYLVDSMFHRIINYDFKLNSLNLIFGYFNGTSGNDSSSLNSPHDIQFNSNQMYIVDSLNHRILVTTISSKQASNLFGTGQSGSSNTQLNNPMSITMDTNSNIYIADYGNNRIVQFNLINNQTNIYLSFNTNQLRNTYVVTPISLKYHSLTNSLVIGQQMGYNVIRWTLNSTQWTLIAGSVSSELNGTSRTLFNQICAIDIDDQMNTFIADCQNQRIQYFQGDGTKGRTIAGVIQAAGTNPYLFNYPNAITFDQNRSLYISDSQNQRIQLFQRI